MTSNERGIKKVEGRIIPVDGDDIDTDRIIPARFMKVLTFDGLGAHAFHDERFNEQGGKKTHPFNDERYAGAGILLTGNNFGCGSSREHAPQALMRFGIRAIIGISFGDIFAGNCTQLGIPAVGITREHHAVLSGIVLHDPETSCTIDLVDRTIAAGESFVPCTIGEAAAAVLRRRSRLTLIGRTYGSSL